MAVHTTINNDTNCDGRNRNTSIDVNTYLMAQKGSAGVKVVGDDVADDVARIPACGGGNNKVHWAHIIRAVCSAWTWVEGHPTMAFAAFVTTMAVLVASGTMSGFALAAGLWGCCVALAKCPASSTAYVFVDSSNVIIPVVTNHKRVSFAGLAQVALQDPNPVAPWGFIARQLATVNTTMANALLTRKPGRLYVCGSSSRNSAAWVPEAEAAGFQTTLLKRVDVRPGVRGEQSVDDDLHKHMANTILDVASNRHGMVARSVLAIARALALAPRPVLVQVSGDGNDNGGRGGFPQQVRRAMRMGMNVEVRAWKACTSARYAEMVKEVEEQQRRCTFRVSVPKLTVAPLDDVADAIARDAPACRWGEDCDNPRCTFTHTTPWQASVVAKDNSVLVDDNVVDDNDNGDGGDSDGGDSDDGDDNGDASSELSGGVEECKGDGPVSYNDVNNDDDDVNDDDDDDEDDVNEDVMHSVLLVLPTTCDNGGSVSPVNSVTSASSASPEPQPQPLIARAAPPPPAARTSPVQPVVFHIARAPPSNATWGRGARRGNSNSNRSTSVTPPPRRRTFAPAWGSQASRFAALDGGVGGGSSSGSTSAPRRASRHERRTSRTPPERTTCRTTSPPRLQPSSSGSDFLTRFNTPCRYGVGCTLRKCGFVHPVGWVRPRLTANDMEHVRRVGGDAAVATAGATATFTSRSRFGATPCRYGLECFNTACKFKHGEGWDPKTASRSVRRQRLSRHRDSTFAQRAGPFQRAATAPLLPTPVPPFRRNGANCGTTASLRVNGPFLTTTTSAAKSPAPHCA